MDAKARKALETIRGSVAAKRYTVSQHFAQRMDERAFFWPDVLAVLDRPGKVRDDGRDRFGRPKWIIAGNTPDGIALELVCAIDTDERGRLTVFITIY
jgi:hypothetical protein